MLRFLCRQGTFGKHKPQEFDGKVASYLAALQECRDMHDLLEATPDVKWMKKAEQVASYAKALIYEMKVCSWIKTIPVKSKLVPKLLKQSAEHAKLIADGTVATAIQHLVQLEKTMCGWTAPS